MRTRTPYLSGIALALSALLTISACSDNADAEPSNTDGVEYSFAMTTSGAIGPLYQLAIERMDEATGHKGTWVEMTNSEVAVGGTASNDFQFTGGVASTVMAAIQEKDANLIFVNDMVKIMWTMTGATDIEKCDDLEGKKVGLHSPGGVSTAIFHSWLEKNCDPSTDMQIVYIEGSPNRLQGLLAGQIDATMLKLDELEQLTDDFHVIDNFAQSMPEIVTNATAVNGDFADQHPELVEDFVYYMMEVVNDIYEDPQVFVDAIEKYQPELADQADYIAQIYVDSEVLIRDGGIPEDWITTSIALYEEADAIGTGLSASDIIERSYIEAAQSRNQE